MPEPCSPSCTRPRRSSAGCFSFTSTSQKAGPDRTLLETFLSLTFLDTVQNARPWILSTSLPPPSYRVRRLAPCHPGSGQSHANGGVPVTRPGDLVHRGTIC